MTKKSKIIYFLTTFIFFVIFNRYFTNLVFNNNISVPQNPIFDFTFIQNEGAAFNIFEGAKMFLIVFSFCAMIGIVFYALKKTQ